MCRIAIDVGGVLIQKEDFVSDVKEDTVMDVKEDTTIDINGPKWGVGYEQVLPQWCQEGHELYILSFCGKKREEETRQCLRANPIIAQTIPESRWIFTRRREWKANMCQQFQINILIDDRQDNLDHCKQMNPTLTVVCYGPSSCRTFYEVAEQIKHL